MRRTLLWLIALVPALSALPVRAEQALPDSTTTASWRLANGLEVRTRHVPRAPGIAVTLAVRAGRGHDPSALDGLADLLAAADFAIAIAPLFLRADEKFIGFLLNADDIQRK